MRIRSMTIGAVFLSMMSFGVHGTAIAGGEESDTTPAGVVNSGSCLEDVNPSAGARAACRYLGTTERYEAIPILFTDRYLLRFKAMDRCVQADDGELYLVFCIDSDKWQQWTRSSVSPEGTIYHNYAETDVCVGVANTTTSRTADTAITLAG